MTLLLGSLQLGLTYGLLAIGVYIAFRILNIPDLTAEGSFTFGLAVSARLTVSGHPYLSIVAAVIAGMAAGCVTGLFQTKLRIHPVLAGILTMSGLYSVNLLIMGSSSNLSLIGSSTIFRIMTDKLPFLTKEGVKTLLPFLFVLIIAILMILFFKTRIGLCIRATGNNEDMVRASSIDVDTTKILALAVSNGSIALSGALIAQYQGFADINSGVGILVVGLASVIIGELICRKDSVSLGILAAIIGSVIYRYMIAVALKYSPFPAYALKLVSACIVAIALSLPAIQYQAELKKIRRGARKS